jgi:3-phytase
MKRIGQCFCTFTGYIRSHVAGRTWSRRTWRPRRGPLILRWLILTLAAPAAIQAADTAGLASRKATDPEPVVRPRARVETAVVPHRGDAADDPAIWIHPSVPDQSLVLGTDKRGALFAYNMDGSIHQVVSEGAQPNNVDVLYEFPLGSNVVDLAFAAVRKAGARGLKVWSIDPTSRRLADVTAGGVIPVFAGQEPYGSCVYRSARDRRAYGFVNNKRGQVEQYQLTDTGTGQVAARKLRGFAVKSTTEGCVADDELGFFYLSEEGVGIWKFGAEPEAGSQGTLIARVGEHGLKSDVEGLTIYYAPGGLGYLIASSQGNDTFKVYERQDGHRFLLTIDPRGGRIDDVSDTDGICVVSCSAGGLFPKGLFVVQDGGKSGGRQNFKLFAWEDIAGSSLKIDTTWSPRTQTAR